MTISELCDAAAHRIREVERIEAERKTRLLAKLADLHRDQSEGSGDTEMIHIAADNALLDYVGDVEVVAAFMRLKRFYS